jgi:hypothetical protein
MLKRKLTCSDKCLSRPLPLPLSGVTVDLRLDGPSRREVVGPAFSAASRDLSGHGFESIADYFQRNDLDDVLTRVQVMRT